MTIQLQKGFNTMGIDIFVILYHIWLYHRVGISPLITWSQMIFSFMNFIFLRQLILWTVSFLNFNSEYTNNTFFVLFQVGFFYLIQEFYMYFAHRFMHWNKFLYNWVHRRHHLLNAECFTTATYMSPIEIIVHIYPNIILGPVIFNFYFGYIFKEAFFIWSCLANFYFVWSHSGVNDSQYMPSIKHHWLHHKYYNVNYGSWLTDKLFGTIRYND
ncbi:fatty acid hydroxylase superfamily [Indivirus ILV1]|uniref:Fatty acid hydroxylase superfamily n=1 Tax=Indivirus ILV1 TaxID=1977633 RepID=A0A1V0SE28_9VIRU|nr:fatty acid hydroxylase superfamily [Indivirus ILV1]